jgi:hypothetical protein
MADLVAPHEDGYLVANDLLSATERDALRARRQGSM